MSYTFPGADSSTDRSTPIGQKRDLKSVTNLANVTTPAYSASPSQLISSEFHSPALHNPYSQYQYQPQDPTAFSFSQAQAQHTQSHFRPPSQPASQAQQHRPTQYAPAPQQSPNNSRKRRASELEGGSSTPTSSIPSYGHGPSSLLTDPNALGGQGIQNAHGLGGGQGLGSAGGLGGPSQAQLPNPTPKKGRTNTPWTPAEEQRLKALRDAGSSWSEIAKTFPTRTEGSVKKHWYKDMHYAEFAEDESAALLQAIKDYENNKWKVIGAKVGKPAKACEQFAKEQGWKV
ncbi:hypothetical protein K431DRAFT_329363 [Polychaeton citri CBS 116435]|uniref:Myb-like transcription factor n=1 Tax=Polychaeton citri CBS 116435 TaxID=1314669 RepID=A0A9P4Q5A5_9PEZI|nr:hypothetical protein K431DRAFT_329363 [Polychaeton citri CBS 116435]